MVFNHTGTKGYTLFTIALTKPLYPFYLCFSILCKVAVPLFFMVSGALLLGRQESFGNLLKTRVLRILVVLVVASGVMYLYVCLRQSPQELSLVYFLRTLYTSRITVPYWYLYTYLAYLLMLPILRRLACAMKRRDYLWMCVASGLINAASMVEWLIWQGDYSHSSYFSFFITTNYVFYPLMGYFIGVCIREEDLTLKGFAALAGMALASIIATAMLTHYKCTLTSDWSSSAAEAYFNKLIFMPTLTVFYGARLLFARRPLRSERARRMLAMAGSLTFGIYLTEQLCRNETSFVFSALVPYVHSLPACLVWVCVACLLGALITYLLRKVPVLRRYL